MQENVDYVLKGASEKLTKQMEAQLSEMNSRIEESQRTVIDINYLLFSNKHFHRTHLSQLRDIFSNIYWN
jgi:TolA-binding protein